MSPEQRNQHCKSEEGLEAQDEVLGLAGVQAPLAEEQEASSFSSPLTMGTLEGLPTAGSLGSPQSPRETSISPTTIDNTLCSQSNEGSSSQEEEALSTSLDPTDLKTLFRETLNGKVAEL
ncbi:Melanoma-associated antigen 4, partial [Saguinus oedipus]